MTDLKPCPFCGGEAKMQKSKRWPDDADAAVDGYTAVCQNLDCILGGNDEWWADTEAEAIAAWNTRAERTCHIEHMPKNENLRCRSWLQCSECGEEITNYPQDWNYCPNCGAKVVD